MSLRSASPLMVLLACGPAPTDPTDPAPPDPTGATGLLSSSGHTGHTGHTGASGRTGHTGTPAPTADTGPAPIAFDCTTIPLQVGAVRELPGARGYHDVEFTDDGYILGMSAGFSPDLIKADYAGTAAPLTPSLGLTNEMAWLPDGNLAVATADMGIVRIAADGSRSILNGGIRAYGLVLGPDDMLYAADLRTVLRIDPTTGDAVTILPENSLLDGGPRVLNFDLDYSHLYLGTYQGSLGRIYSVELDAAYNPVSAPEVLASGVGSGQFHDAIGVDLCGYLYVPDFSSATLWRVSPSGLVQRLFETTGTLQVEYGHGITWGTGRHGWDDFALYMPKPYKTNLVNEVHIGVPGRDWPHGYAINLP